MPDMLAIVSKAVFERDARRAGGGLFGLGDTLLLDRYVSTHKAFEPLRAGGRLFLVTVRPPNESLWLVAVLDSPHQAAGAWVAAAPYDVPITDISHLRSKIAFASGKGMSQEKGALGMSLQVPRLLAAPDSALLDACSRPRASTATASDWRLTTLVSLETLPTEVGSLRFGSGDVTLEGVGRGKERRLWIVATRQGLLVEWLSLSDASFVYMVEGSPGRRGGAKMMHDNGEVDVMPARLCCTVEQALRATDTFVRTGEREPSLSWTYADGLPAWESEGDAEEDEDDEDEPAGEGSAEAPELLQDVGSAACAAVEARGDALDPLRMSGRFTLDRYRRSFANEPAAGADVPRLRGLTADLDAVVRRLDAAGCQDSEVARALRAEVGSWNECEATIRRARAAWPWNMEELWTKLLEQQHVTYQKFFAGQSRATRRPALLEAVVAELRAIQAGLLRLAESSTKQGAETLLGTAAARITMYERELGLIRDARETAPAAARIDALHADAAKLVERHAAASDAEGLLDDLDEVRVSSAIYIEGPRGGSDRDC